MPRGPRFPWLIPALLLVALLPVPLHADGRFGIRHFRNYCTTGSFVSCASVSVQVLQMPHGYTGLVVRIRNLAGAHQAVNNDWMITYESVNFPNADCHDSDRGCDFLHDPSMQLGFARSHGPVGDYGLGYLPDFTATEAGYLLFDAGNSTGIAGCVVPAGAAGAVVTCRSQGYPGEWVFSIATDHPVGWDVHDAQVEWGFSDVNHPPSGVTCRPGVNCFPAPATAAPEPVTLALLGTGLVGVGAAARRRRRPD